jgi:hypothetical protein
MDKLPVIAFHVRFDRQPGKEPDLIPPVLSPADLILLKEDSWRQKDRLEVLVMLEGIARETGTK